VPALPATSIVIVPTALPVNVTWPWVALLATWTTMLAAAPSARRAALTWRSPNALA
jgi:hypothetical protein